MTTAMTLQHLGPLPAAYQKSKVDAGDLGAGIGQSFATLTFKGKVFRVAKSGTETMLMRADNSGPLGQLEVVIVKAAPVISKIWYEKGYVEGDRAPPDCWSVNGHAPDPASPKKQSTTCAGCKQNMWGSRVSEAGKAGKACSDSKRLAIVAAADIKSESTGGPMLLRVPPASLQGLSAVNAALVAQGLRYDAVVMKLSFNHQVAHPELVFEPIRVLNDAEAELVIEHQESDVTQRMLAEAVDQVRAEAAGDAAKVVTPVTTPAPVVATPVVQVQPVAPNPFAVASTTQQVGTVSGAYDPGPMPAGLVRTAAPVVAQVQPVQQPVQQVAPVTQQVQPPTQSEDPELDMTPTQLPGESQMDFLTRLQKIIAAQAAPKTRKPRARVAPPTPAPADTTPAAQAPVQQVAPVQQAVAQPTQDAGAMASLDAELDALL